MTLRSLLAAALALTSAAGCSSPTSSIDDGASALRNGLATAPGQAGQKLAEAATGDEPDRERQRPVNPALMAARARLQAIRTSTVLGESRALLHNSDFDKLKEAMKGQ